jgi:hypothetical protein
MEALIPLVLYLAVWVVVLWGSNYFNRNVV